jgi:hypothetical protein
MSCSAGNIDKRCANVLKTSNYLTARISMLPSIGYERCAVGFNAKAQTRANVANKSKKQSLM